MTAVCPSCGAGLETPLACDACGYLVEAEIDPGPFEVLGLEPSFSLDAADLRKRLRRITRLVHPDFHAIAGAEVLARSERNNALLNDAYQLLSDDVRRADRLVSDLGGPSEKDLGTMPQAFLMEVMEWNETLEEAAPGSDEFARLEGELLAHRDQLAADIEAALTPLPAPGAPALAAVRQHLNARRYVDRALARVSTTGPSA